MSGIIRTADISECGRYRYDLRIVEDASLSSLTVIMCNPSTADATKDDPTVQRCRGFARRLGFGGLTVVNLFAYRATDPADLRTVAHRYARDAIGPRNELAIEAALPESGYAVAAWGAVAESVRGFEAVLHHVTEATCGSVELRAFGVTSSGAPKHPLARGHHRIPDDAMPVPWEPRR